MILLSYAIHKVDPVFIVGQSCGFLIYSRNIFLIKKEGKNKKNDPSKIMKVNWVSMNFTKVHQEILKKSRKYCIIKNEIEKNGIIKIQKSRLDFFSFVIKTTISHQSPLLKLLIFKR